MRILIVRLGAFGDCLIVSPLIKYLWSGGHEIYMLTSEDQGKQIYENNPYVDKMIYHKKDSIPSGQLGDYFESVKTAYECDRLVDLCESIEYRLCLIPIDPRYKYTKPEIMAICNKNYYEETFAIARQQLDPNNNGVGMECWGTHPVSSEILRPEMHFTEAEKNFLVQEMARHIGKFKILWGLSGSSRQKTYPIDYVLEVIRMLNKTYKDIEIFTVGDGLCQLLEIPFEEMKNVHRRSGEWTMRQSILACDYVDVVISADTGLLHGAGCYETPKIGLLTHTTTKNITKHFLNDYSLEAKDVACAPCFHMLYKANVQAQLAEDETTPMCMMYGIPPASIFNQIQRIRREYYEQT